MLLALAHQAQAQGADVSVTVRNATARALECQMLAAHWYSWPALTAAPGHSVTFRLLLRADGAVIDGASGLPVERLFCGPAGRAWQGRADIDLNRLATGAVVCRDRGGGTGVQ